MNPIDYLLGIDLGGTRLKMVALTSSGRELERFEASTCDDGSASFRAAVRSGVETLTRRLGQPQSIGLAAPGLARDDNRAIALMPTRLEGLSGFEWSDFLGADTHVFNDAHAALAGEVWLGAAQQVRHAFMLTLGTGVGGAIVADGKVLQGTLGRAGHLGHICLDVEGAPDIVHTPGSLEDLIGNHNIGVRSGGRFASTHDLVAAYEAGDEEASRVWLRSIRALGCAIASLINVLDPEIVVLGGGIVSAGASLLAPLEKVLDATEWRPCGARVPIVPAQLGDHAGAVGAAFLARKDTLNSATDATRSSSAL